MPSCLRGPLATGGLAHPLADPLLTLDGRDSLYRLGLLAARLLVVLTPRLLVLSTSRLLVLLARLLWTPWLLAWLLAHLPGTLLARGLLPPGLLILPSRRLLVLLLVLVLPPLGGRLLLGRLALLTGLACRRRPLSVLVPVAWLVASHRYRCRPAEGSANRGELHRTAR